MIRGPFRRGSLIFTLLDYAGPAISIQRGRPMQSNPLLDLLPAGAATMPLLEELGAALIAYTPEKFQVIHCEITEGLEAGQRALFYKISCPQFPDDGTTVANDRVHKAATRLVQHVAPKPGAFPGAVVTLTMQQDGTWRHNLRLLAP